MNDLTDVPLWAALLPAGCAAVAWVLGWVLGRATAPPRRRFWDCELPPAPSQEERRGKTFTLPADDEDARG